jgi:hypothetical protein
LFFKTLFEQVKDDLENYDVVQVNMSPMDMTIIPEIRRRLKSSSTQLVLNNDYVCEYWGKFGIDPYYYDMLQRMGDMVFGTEKHQVSNMINGSFCLPHPTNTKVLKRLGSDHESDSIGFLYHWWAGETYLPNRVCEIAKKKFDIKKSRVYGYDPKYDNTEKFQKIMFDEKLPLMRFPQFAQMIQGERIVYDPNPCHTYGRNGVELACFRKPVVGSDRVQSYNKLFKPLTCDPFDTTKTLEIMDKVVRDTEEVQKAIDEAYKNVEYYNYRNAKKRFMEALEISKQRGGSAWYQQHG